MSYPTQAVPHFSIFTDEQCEVVLLSGQHLVHDIGYIEAGLTESPEMIVLCADTIGRLRHFTAGMALDKAALPRLLGTFPSQSLADARLGQAWKQTARGSLA